MAFQTGTSTSIENLLQQLSTFLQANGWTEDYAVTGDPGTIAFSKNQSFVSFQYSETADSVGTMACYQARANDTVDTADPWLSTGDSGAGVANNILSQLDNGLCVNNFAGPHTAYFFFENNANPSYCHVVVEVDAGRYRHFGFGELDKVGDWTGGEYIYGQTILAGSQSDDPASVFNGYGADSSRSQGSFQIVGATMRIEGHVGEPDPATVWGFWHNATTHGGDRAGNPRWNIGGGHRFPPEFAAQHFIRASEANAFKPMSPISNYAENRSGAPDQRYLLGYFADQRLVNIGNLDPGQIITIAGDQWYFFPWVRKRNLQDNTEESRNYGIAYRRENA